MKVITGKVRASFVNVFTPRAAEPGQTPKYSMMILIPKSDTETLSKIKAAQKDAIEKKWGGKVPAGLKNTLRDGDEKDPMTGATRGDEYAGHYFMNISSKERPQIIDAQRQPVLDAGEFMSGDYCRVSMNSFAYEMSGNRGVSFGLNNIQVLGKGAPLGNVSRAEDEFGEWNEGGNAAADDIFG